MKSEPRPARCGTRVRPGADRRARWAGHLDPAWGAGAPTGRGDQLAAPEHVQEAASGNRVQPGYAAQGSAVEQVGAHPEALDVALNLFTNYVNVALAVPVDFPSVPLRAAA